MRTVDCVRNSKMAAARGRIVNAKNVAINRGAMLMALKDNP
jgi:hypothetical protein